MRHENERKEHALGGAWVDGLVFDYAGKQTPDLGGLTLLLTARMLADREDRKVWVRALPDHTWQVLHSLGLDHMFELFPNSGKLVN